MGSTTYHQKRGGFIKGKLMPTLNKKICSSKVKQSHGGSNNNNKNPNCVVKQDVKPEPLQKTLAYDRGYDSSIGRIESFFGVMDDEGVNMKAANYILSVHERFRLERTVSERNIISTGSYN